MGVGLTVAVLAALGLAGPALDHWGSTDAHPPKTASDSSGCVRTTVAITVTPELLAPVRAGLEPVQGTRLIDGRCLEAVVTAEPASDTVRGVKAKTGHRRPQLWIPDSSLWERQMDSWVLRKEGSLASSPVVIATSETVVKRLGWAQHVPTWAVALSGLHPVAIPDLQANSSGVLSILRLWQTLGKKNAADHAVAAAVLASTRSSAPTQASAVAAAERNDPEAPLLITSEFTVFTTNRSNASSRLVAVYPTDGSPVLDYPILRVAPTDQTAPFSIATDTVVEALTSTATGNLIRRNGLRDTNGAGTDSAGARSRVFTLDIPSPAEVTAFLRRLHVLTLPARLTLVFDVSLSMRTAIGEGLTRAQLAAQAAAGAANLMSDRSSVGMWIFSRNLAGSAPGTHFRQLDPLGPVGQTVAGRARRDLVNAHLSALNDMLSGDGTALYATILAAMKSAQERYDPNADNAIILYTDGKNDDPGGISLAQLLTELKRLADPQRPVRLIAIGLGLDTDVTVLRQIVAPSRGAAYVVTAPEQLRRVMLDAMTHRTF